MPRDDDSLEQEVPFEPQNGREGGYEPAPDKQDLEASLKLQHRVLESVLKSLGSFEAVALLAMFSHADCPVKVGGILELICGVFPDSQVAGRYSKCHSDCQKRYDCSIQSKGQTRCANAGDVARFLVAYFYFSDTEWVTPVGEMIEIASFDHITLIAIPSA